MALHDTASPAAYHGGSVDGKTHSPSLERA